MKKVLKSVAAFMLALAMCVSTTGTVASAEASVNAGGAQGSWDGMTTVNKYVGENFNVTFSLAGYWNGGYNANIKVENTGSSVIENWYLSFALNNKLTTIWNAEVVSNENGQYVVKNANWNADIPVGGCAEFGISVNENFAGFPSMYKLLGENTQVQEEAYSVEYILDSDWGNGFTARVLLTNRTEETLEDWTLEFDFDREITSIWNGVIEAHEGNHYVIKNAGHNANIAAGQTISFGFNGEKGTAEQKPENCELSSFIQGNGSEEEIDFEDTTDTDSDFLTDVLEKYYGTNKNNPDTDGDGLSDYIEIVILGTNPLSMETNAGVLDVTLDSDEDGLGNGEEVRLGLNPGDDDTDGDLLTDAEELKLGTDPLNYDTDGDDASDCWEVSNGTNPLVAEVSFDVTYVSTYEDAVKTSVELELTGEQVETLAVEPVLGGYLFPEDMPGYIGSAYNFSVEGEFDTAKLYFEFDPTQLPEGAVPTIYYFNETEQDLEALETTITGNVASAVVEHFSTYILINRTVYDSSFEWEDTWTEAGKYNSIEIVFVVDDSGSMGPVGANNDPNNERLAVARDLIDKLPEKSKIGVVWFASSTKLLTSELTADKYAAKQLLTTNYFKSSGGTYMYSAIKSAFGLFASTDEKTLRVMVVLSDGITDDTAQHTNCVLAAQENGIRIYTVGLGSSTSYFNNYMKPLAQRTGGTFYLASNANELAAIYKDIQKGIDLETDSDSDGLPDYYEENMFSFNGKKITLDKNKKDTDGDGLLDGEEVEAKLEYNFDKSRVYVKGKMVSYPDRVDTDMDAIDDYNDPDPMEYTITDRTLAFVEGLSYTNLESYIGRTVGDALKGGVHFKNVSDENIEYLKDAIIVDANDSANKILADFWDEGLGSVAVKIVRSNKPTSVIYALRGTEFKEDGGNDVTADLDLGVGWDTTQSKKAFKEYKAISSVNNSFDYYVVGHSLGGRLAQDVLYKIYNANEGGVFKKKANIKTPVHSATFNGLGYNKLVYATLENDVLSKYKGKLVNFYYKGDAVGDGLGVSLLFKRAGTQVKLTRKGLAGNDYEEKLMANHGIVCWHNDYSMLYSSHHDFNYWAD